MGVRVSQYYFRQIFNGGVFGARGEEINLSTSRREGNTGGYEIACLDVRNANKLLPVNQKYLPASAEGQIFFGGWGREKQDKAAERVFPSDR